MFALDLANRDLYQLSGSVQGAGSGNAGFPYGSWENAALLDTGEKNHVALLLSPDGWEGYDPSLKLYVGHKTDRSDPNFLSRNGLSSGSWYHLIGDLPSNVGIINVGSFSTSESGALTGPGDKLEDVDTNPDDPSQAVLAEQNRGVFTFNFNLGFSPTGGLDMTSSSFDVRMIQRSQLLNDTLQDPDNVDWVRASVSVHPDGQIFVNSDRSSGSVWHMNPDGSGLTEIAQTTGGESSGIFDLSEFVGYEPGSVLISTSQGSTSSMTVLINPLAQLSGTAPSSEPTSLPSTDPAKTFAPSSLPSPIPVEAPILHPSFSPPLFPSLTSTVVPSRAPSKEPTLSPNSEPTAHPSWNPSNAPNPGPVALPVPQPTTQPPVVGPPPVQEPTEQGPEKECEFSFPGILRYIRCRIRLFLDGRG
jgi:hypothetical protein